MLQIGAASLSQIRASVITKLLTLLQNRAAITICAKCITNWSMYYKLGQLLQIRA